MKQHTKFYANGQWLPSTGKDHIDVTNPYTEEAIASVQSSSPKDITTAVHAAHVAFKSWSQSSVHTRIDLLKKIALVLKDQQEELGQTRLRHAIENDFTCPSCCTDCHF